MKAHGVTITQASFDACLNRMKTGPFRTSDIAKAASDIVVPAGGKLNSANELTYRLAVKLIAYRAKQGNLKPVADRCWVWA